MRRLLLVLLLLAVALGVRALLTGPGGADDGADAGAPSVAGGEGGPDGAGGTGADDAPDGFAAGADPASADAPDDAPRVAVADYFLLPLGRRALLRSPEKPGRFRELEAGAASGPAGFDGDVLHLDVLDDTDVLRLFFGWDDERLLLLGFTIDREALDTEDTWFTPPVPLADADVALDGETRATAVTAGTRLVLRTPLLDIDQRVTLSGDVSVRWRPADPVDAGDARRWDDVVALELGLALTAKAESLPLERELEGGVSGVLARGVGWVQLADARRSYVLEPPPTGDDGGDGDGDGDG